MLICHFGVMEEYPKLASWVFDSGSLASNVGTNFTITENVKIGNPSAKASC